MQGVFLDQDSLDKDDLDFSALNDSLDNWTFYSHSEPEQVIERIQDVEVIVSNKVFLGEKEISRAKKLRLICVAATGTNNIDLNAAKKYNIEVCNVRAYGTDSVAQHVLCLMLMLLRRIPQYQQSVKQGDWQKSTQFCLMDHPIEELTNKTLGIIGYGELGQKVASIAEFMGMKIMLACHGENQTGRFSVEEILKQADVITLHCPLTESTRHMIAEKQFAMMKQTAFIINAARGGIIEEKALKKALMNGDIAGAATDVLEKEPPSNDSILLSEEIPNLIVTPHIAWASRQARQNLLNQVADNIEKYFQGRTQNSVY